MAKKKKKGMPPAFLKNLKGKSSKAGASKAMPGEMTSVMGAAMGAGSKGMPFGK